MIYLINIYTGDKVVAAKTNTRESADKITEAFKDLGVDVFPVGWFCWWLQTHRFVRLAAVLAPLSNPE